MRFCYTHQRQHDRNARQTAERNRQRWFESVDLNDAKSIQRALREVMLRVVENKVEPRKAGQLLYKLQGAVANLPQQNEHS